MHRARAAFRLRREGNCERPRLTSAAGDGWAVRGPARGGEVVVGDVVAVIKPVPDASGTYGRAGSLASDPTQAATRQSSSDGVGASLVRSARSGCWRSLDTGMCSGGAGRCSRWWRECRRSSRTRSGPC